MPVAIMSAVQEELALLVTELADADQYSWGGRTYHQGVLWGNPTILTFSRWGKVASATTASYLLSHFGARALIFTGVAGGVDRSLAVGDIVIASKLYQHDMDARPLFERFEVPLLGVDSFAADQQLNACAVQASNVFLKEELQNIPAATLGIFAITEPKVVVGDIASGDKFFAEQAAVDALRAALPTTQAVEMEGGACAQVCFELGVPCCVIRTISDAANETAAIDFTAFISDVARVYSHGILRHLLQQTAFRRFMQTLTDKDGARDN